ncbi:MAG: GTP 3',8-cyclase [Candidatus Hydrogenedentota bacterium]
MACMTREAPESLRAARDGVVRDRLGRPLRDLRISVTDRCNLRCAYCMPAESYPENHCFQPREALLSFEEIARIARIAADLGVHKIRLTGGEPLLRHNLDQLVSMLAGLPTIQDLALTTNGLLLPRYARPLRDAGMNRITVSLDSLDPTVLRQMCGRDVHPDLVLDGIAAARDAGFESIKVNTVLQRGMNDGSIVDLARHFRGTGIVLRFIEFMDVGTMNQWKLDRVVPAREVMARIHEYFPLEPVAPSYPGEVASRYRYADGQGEIGVIASVTRPFCGGCSRLRLTCDGHLFTCLFAARGLDLRPSLRGDVTDGLLVDQLRGLWVQRTDRYSEERGCSRSHRPEKAEMYHIGG